MIKIKFNGGIGMNDVSFVRISNHVVELGGITDAPTTGFTTWRMDGKTQLGDFSGYTSIYRTLDNAVQLSDDGSVYVEPVAPDTPAPGEPQPTQLERIEALEATTDDIVLMMADMIGG